MMPTREPTEVANSAAETEVSQAKSRQRAESAHLRADAVSLEIPIKVHGSLVPSAALGAPAQAQPFEEQTTTMIVFPQGGVLKMSTGVSAGQVMVLTNLKSRQDAICRVVKVRAYGKTQSYVEVEFTSPQAGYWGVYFPTDGPEVARMAPAQPSAESSISTQPPAAQSSSVPAAPPAPARIEQKVSDVSWASAASILPPVSKAPEQLTRVEAPQVAIAPPRPPAAPKLPESSFASIGTKEEVLAPADATRTPRLTSFPASTIKSQTAADADISDAIDALMVPAARAVPSLPPNRAASEAPASASPQTFASPAQSTRAEETGLPVPKQMFGVTLDSASLGSAPSSQGSSGRMWISIGVAAVLAVAAAGAYFHFRGSGNVAPSTAAVTAASAPAAQPASFGQNPAASTQSDTGAAQQTPDQASEALQSSSSSAETVSSTAGSNRDLPASAPEPSARSREVESAAARRTAIREQGENKAATSEPSQANMAIPSTFGVLNARPVLRANANAGSVGEAPALEANGSAAEPIGSLPTIAASAPNVPAPPKPVSTAPIRVGGKILPPRLVSSVLPVYPPIAQQANVTGTVVIDTTIDKNGNVAKTKVISGPQLLRGAALTALRQWKYEPSRLDGQPISVEMVVSIQFH